MDHIPLIQESNGESAHQIGGPGNHTLKMSTTQFTRRQLKLRPDFDEWLAAKFKQLDTHHSDDLFKEPFPRPRRAVVL
jgi:hypothetical protein